MLLHSNKPLVAFHRLGGKCIAFFTTISDIYTRQAKEWARVNVTAAKQLVKQILGSVVCSEVYSNS